MHSHERLLLLLFYIAPYAELQSLALFPLVDAIKCRRRLQSSLASRNREFCV